MRRHALITFLLPLAILSCASTERNPRGQLASADSDVREAPGSYLQGALEQAQRLEATGQWVAAALSYTKLSTLSPPPRRQVYALRAANLLQRGNMSAQAKQTIVDTDWSTADPDTQFERVLFSARLALAERDAKSALDVLAGLEVTPQVSAVQKIEYRSLRIRAFDMVADYAASLNEHVSIEGLFVSENDVNLNQQAIAALLPTIPEETLTLIAATSLAPETRGWAELGLALRQRTDRASLTAAIAEWRNRNQMHPITATTLASLAPTSPDRLSAIASIGLLLPSDGPTAVSAVAVRDGFIAAYYTLTSPNVKPNIKVYNTGPSGENVLAAYRQAVSEGVSIVVGPLHKSAVEALAGLGRLPVPTLALNEISPTLARVENLFQFSLSPDNEARQVAERAWADGATQAVMLYPKGAWGERVSNAFRQRWQQLGGIINASEIYQTEKSEYSTPLKKVLGIEGSANRLKALANVIQTKPKFEPRLRRDIEFIFMAAYPLAARQIMPQLAFHQATHIPVYATSHTFSGSADKKADSDLDGVIVGDMPWTLLPSVGSQPVRDKVVSNWKGNLEQQSRLYALGVDAYNVLPYLGWLQGNPSARWQGVTGILALDETNHVTRQLTWAKFVSGLPKPLSSVTPAPDALPAP